jgi:WD40 repeat protein
MEEDVVVMGTAVGSLIFYSVAKSGLMGHTEEAHAGPVTGLTWDQTTLALYSCGTDGYIIEWDPESLKTVR